MLPLLLLSTVAPAAQPAFSAGTYGRVQASTDLQGGGGDAVQVASHAPRLHLGPYMELDLGWELVDEEGATFRVLITPALSGDLFHYDGQWGDDLALRNFFAEATGLTALPLTVWAGSRMYRGDDIYLLDFWPLDNLNTYGGGAILAPGDSELALHAGVNRLVGEDWQVQTATVAVPGRVEGEEILVLDRQRTIASAALAHHFRPGALTLRVKAYGEVHLLPSGERIDQDLFDQLEVEELPSDRGSLAGVQLSLWGWADQSFVHLWARRATGLAAFGELAIPVDGLALDLRAAPARSWMFALAGNHEAGPVGIMAGAYASSFVDADAVEVDLDDRWELVGVLRPQVYVGEHVALGGEVSHQWVRPNGINPRSGELDRPSITKLSLLPAIQAGRGGYTRPRLQLQYTVSLLDEDALDWFSSLDARVDGPVQHFVGLGAEWWLNSRRVITPQETSPDPVE